MNKIPLIFMGSPAVAVTILQSLLDADYEITAVVTQPDKPAGRGQKLSPPPVKVFAEEKGLKVLQPTKIKTPEFFEEIKKYPAKALIVAAYGKILPQEILELTPHPLNVHFSLLPKYRGASCVAQAILNGDAKTGVTIMKVVEKLDAGPILKQISTPIEANETTGLLETRLAKMGANLLLTVLSEIENEKIQYEEQDETKMTYAPLIKKEEAKIDWQNSAEKIYNQVRALNPWPIAYTFVDGKRIKIYAGHVTGNEPSTQPGEIGKITNEGIQITCGQKGFLITEIQLEGKNRMPASEARKGYPNLFTSGKILGK